MIKQIQPLSQPVNARVQVPGSKSITNRALICAALASGDSVIRNASDSDDSAMMANGLNQLGILVRKKGEDLIVEGRGGRVCAPKFPIPVGNAGTTLRFLAGMAALADGAVTFESHSRMVERPMTGLLDALYCLGTASRIQEFAGRYVVQGGTFDGGTTSVESDLTSQYVSSLLMVSPYAKNNVRLQLDTEPVSNTYIDMTLSVMKEFGVEVENADGRSFSVKSGRRFLPIEFSIEGDWSSAAYFSAAGAIARGKVTIEGVSNDSTQADSRIIEILQCMGWESEAEEGGGMVETASLHGIDIDLRSTPDLVPTVAVAALFAEGTTRIRNVAYVRGKESDRLEAIATELRKLGARVILHDDGLGIEPAHLTGTSLQTYNDHRLAMSFALIGLRVPGIAIENPECVSKSFPGFWKEFQKLYEGRQKTA